MSLEATKILADPFKQVVPALPLEIWQMIAKRADEVALNNLADVSMYDRTIALGEKMHRIQKVLQETQRFKELNFEEESFSSPAFKYFIEFLRACEKYNYLPRNHQERADFDNKLSSCVIDNLETPLENLQERYKQKLADKKLMGSLADQTIQQMQETTIAKMVAIICQPEYLVEDDIDFARGSAALIALKSSEKNIFWQIIQQGKISDYTLGKCIQYVADKGDLDIVQALLNIGEIETHYIECAVRDAADCGHLEIVKLLLRSYSISTETSGVCLWSALLKPDLEIAKALLENSQVGHEYMSYCIDICLENGYKDVLEKIFTFDNAQGHLKWEAIKQAVEKSHIEMIKFLFSLNIFDQQSKEDAFVLAACYGATDVIEYLINRWDISLDVYRKAQEIVQEQGDAHIVELFSAYLNLKGL